MLSPSTIPITLKSAGKAHGICCICNKKGGKYNVVKHSARVQFYVQTGILLSKKARACPTHFEKGFLKHQTIHTKVCVKTKLNKTDLGHNLEDVRLAAARSSSSKLDFDIPGNLSDDDYTRLTGLNRAEFDDVCRHADPATIHESQVRSMRSCIAVLLVKLRLGLANSVLGTFFNLNKFQVKTHLLKTKHVYHITI